MKTIVIYNSQTGFTERYAKWIAEETGADCVSFAEGKNRDLQKFDAIVFGGWAKAGTITKLPWLKEQMRKQPNKKYIAFCVGASPIDNPDVKTAMQNLFTEEEHKQVQVFYCPGGINYEKMTPATYLIMKVFAKMMQSKKGQEEAGAMLSSSYDISDKKYIAPIIACLEEAAG